MRRRIGNRRESRGTAHRVALRLTVLLAILGALGCGRSNLKADLDRKSRSDDDLVALLPRGLDLVLDIDVADLRRLTASERLVALLPEPLRTSLESLVAAPLHSLDAVAVGVGGIGSSDASVTLIGRGRIEPLRLSGELYRQGLDSEVEYHGLPLRERSLGAGATPPPTASGWANATALLNSRTLVLGSRESVRQVIDIFRSDDDGARSPSPLMVALGRAPQAKEGRPALLLALLTSAALRERLHQAGLPELGAEAEFLAVALAVGDGLDLGLVVGYRDLQAAQEAARLLLLKSQDLRQRPALSFLGLDRFLQPLVAVATPAAPQKGRPQPELHLAYRLPGDELVALLDRLTTLKQLEQRLSPTAK
jgi:hypothetical protein